MKALICNPGGAFLGAAEHGAGRLIPLSHMFVGFMLLRGSVVLSDVIGPDVLQTLTWRLEQD